MKSNGRFQHAAEVFEEAWATGDKLQSKHGFFAALRYDDFQLESATKLILTLKALPSYEVQCSDLSKGDFQGFRRFVKATWLVPMYLEQKKKSIVASGRYDESTVRSKFDELRREIQRILGFQTIDGSRL